MDTLQGDIGIEVDGKIMDGFLARPATGEEMHPAVIMIHDIKGVSDHARDVTNRFAQQGYVTLAPNLFWNVRVPDFTDRSSMMRFRQTLDDEQMIRDIDAALAHLRDRPEVNVVHVGIVGFCMGGYFASLAALRNPSLAACVDFYGAPLTRLLESVGELRVPFLGLFGDQDQSIPLEQVEQLDAALDETRLPHEIRIYPGAGHAFFNDTSPSYNQTAAQDAWPRVLTFFAEHLQRSPAPIL
ncbi:MAG TPA: dienelactone hydrolase family protein [Chloroflexota bacterium]